MKIVGINGSLREGSVTGQMVSHVLKEARIQGAQTDLVNLKRYNLPFCDGRKNSYGPAVEDLKNRLAQADAFVIGTPEYNGGYSGTLKNLIDLMPPDLFKDKAVALVGAAGGRLGAEGALNQLRLVFKNLESVVLPQQASVIGKDVSDGKINNPSVLKRLSDMGKALVKLTAGLQGTNAA